MRRHRKVMSCCSLEKALRDHGPEQVNDDGARTFSRLPVVNDTILPQGRPTRPKPVPSLRLTPLCCMKYHVAHDAKQHCL